MFFYIVLVATVQTDLLFYALLAPIAKNLWSFFSLVVHGPVNLIFIYVELWLVDFPYFPSMAVFLFIPIEIYFAVWVVAMLADPTLWSFYWFFSFSWVTVFLFIGLFVLYLVIHVANLYVARCCREAKVCCNVHIDEKEDGAGESSHEINLSVVDASRMA